MRCGGGHRLYETQSPLAVRTQVLDPGQDEFETPSIRAGVEKHFLIRADGHRRCDLRPHFAVRTQVLDPGQEGLETQDELAGVEKNTANNEREK